MSTRRDDRAGLTTVEASAQQTPLLNVVDLGHTYGRAPHQTPVVADVTFAVQRGEFVSIVGRSGAGKSTLLRCMAGLQRPTRGQVEIEGRRIDGPPAQLALVFQDYSRSLLPWMSVRANVELPLRDRVPRPEREARAARALGSVGLEGTERRYPWQLSGGMQQRVAIARALAYEPTVLLMDEPFAAVDAQTRADLEDLVIGIQRDFNLTAVFVTHDIDEAVYLADRVIVLSGAPTTVDEIVSIPLGRVRDQLETKSQPAFVEARARVLGLIRRAREQVQ